MDLTPLTCFNSDYPPEDFPWPFYFNGELMPKWAVCWGLAGISDFLKVEDIEDVGHRDVWIVDCKIDHVGVVESEDAEVFIYAVQEVLTILLAQKDSIIAKLKDQPSEVYPNLVEAAFRMRELAVQQRRAFWTSGHETDRLRLIDYMRRCQLPNDSPEFMLPPHVQRLKSMIQCVQECQVRELHQLAQSGKFNKDIRKRLHDIRARPRTE